eukprot:5448125-Amphidinium_carterae.1
MRRRASNTSWHLHGVSECLWGFLQHCFEAYMPHGFPIWGSSLGSYLGLIGPDKPGNPFLFQSNLPTNRNRKKHQNLTPKRMNS